VAAYLAYEFAVRLARAVAGAGAPFDRRVRAALRARRAAPGQLEAWAAVHRDPALPLFWLHAPSVGEALMAQAIIGRLRDEVPGCQVAFTWFSISAEPMVERVGADVTACLPWDVRSDVRRSLDALAPDVVAFIRTEIWPVLAREAKARGVRTALVNAPLAEASSRLRPLARRFLSPAYSGLDAIGAVSDADARRLLRLAPVPGRITVTGDARVDQALARAASPDGGPPVVRRLREPGVPVIVAGSTWPADEDRLIPAFRQLVAGGDRPLRLVIAPHEPTPGHLQRIETEVAAAGFGPVRFSDAEKGADVKAVVIVDRVGVLADLYRAADAAWVGGGFGDAGLHSILEPAALGVPALYGPRFGNAGEAEAMVHAGGGFVATDVPSIVERFRTVLGDGGRAGRAARAWMESQRGGAGRNARLLAGLLPREKRDATTPEPRTASR
jgi:3-deoxy-D-manno-octulosonic-acid transferase